MHAVDDWRDASALVLSCPGALRRQAASLVRLKDARLTQVLLGGDAQILAFAAAFGSLRGALFFASLPEMFSAAARRELGWRAFSETPAAVHLRFGSVREARVLKGLRNIAVVAEAPVAKPAGSASHPFAPGDVLPAAFELVLTYAEARANLSAFGGGVLPHAMLPQACVTADLSGLPSAAPDQAGLDLVSLSAYDESAWAVGDMQPGMASGDPAVLIPWNLAHEGGIVPALLARVAAFADGRVALPRIILLPFNDPGQTGIVRRLIEKLCKAAARPGALLDCIALARATSLGGIKALSGLAGLAWVDGGDPEVQWTVARLGASGITPIVLGSALVGSAHFPTSDTLALRQETRFGVLDFSARLPALRDMPALLATLDAARQTKSLPGA